MPAQVPPAQSLPTQAPKPLTPDFYHYRAAPLEKVELDGSWVHLRWPDGTTLRCFDAWLTENSPNRGFDPVSRESVLDPKDVEAGSGLARAWRTQEGLLELEWTDGQREQLHPGWLRHVADNQHRPDSFLPAEVGWDSGTLPEPPTTDGSRVLENDEILLGWLQDLVRFGLARLRGVPAHHDFLEQLISKVGPIRATNFGSMFTVEAKVDRDSTAYTGLNLGQHTDLPTRETPPGFQFLHCLENTVTGGWSRMTDGATLVAELQRNHPQDYEALTTLRWVFFNRSPTCDHRWSGPLIDHGGPDQPLTIRAFYPVRAFPDMKPKDVPRAYAAMAVLSKLAHSDRFQIRFAFTPGDIVGFDNRRVLHGRDAFQPSDGSRALRGTYMDHDDLYSTLRVLTRKAESGPLED